jgi:hypothetical protein
VAVAHAQLTRQELQDWIVREVRRKLAWPDFAAQVTFMRLPHADQAGATWWLHSLGEEMLKWTPECLDTFVAAVERAQHQFDLTD